MYKVNSNNTPAKITNLFSIAYQRYYLRNSNHFVLPRYNLDIDINSLRYLKWKALLNSLLLRVKSTSLIGMTVGQLATVRSAALLVCSGRSFFTSSRFSPKCASLSLQFRWCSVLILLHDCLGAYASAPLSVWLVVQSLQLKLCFLRLQYDMGLWSQDHPSWWL